MPPAGAGKRKRGDRSWSGDSGPDGQRPSPHRPNNLNMAQQGQSPNQNYARDMQDSRGRGGGRRGNSRGGRGGPAQGRSPVTGSTPMSPPPPRVSLSGATENRDQSATPQPATQPATPQPRPRPREPSPPREPRAFAYDFVTDEITKTWESQGRESLTDTARNAIQQKNELFVSSILQELIQSGVDRRIDPTSAGNVIRDMLAVDEAGQDVDMTAEAQTSSDKVDVQTLFLDTLSILTESEAASGAAQDLVSATGISAEAMREELDSTLLQSLGLIRDTFARMGIRKQTNLLYRQANFNLLREESEGFAKLMTELFTISEKGPASEVVEETVERVKAMIGAFDLDVGKTLDVVLDIFGSVLVKQCRFFVRFLKRSPWWPRDSDFYKDDGASQPRIGGLPAWAQPGSTADEPNSQFTTLPEERDRKFWDRAREIGLAAWFELGRRPASEWHRKNLPAWNGASSEDEADIKKWIEETGTLPPQGNRDAAQLLGFKLRFYSSSAARSSNDILPDNLIYLSALLIKIGFISLKDLYPHLWRPDEEMDSLRQQKTKEKTEREMASRPGAGAKNALLMAGALADDTMPTPIPSRLRDADRASTPSKEADADKTKKPDEKEEALPEPSDQKVSLLKSLLAVGALPEALYILGRFPWLVDLYPELPEFIHRIIHHCIHKVYEHLTPLVDRNTLRDQQRLTDEQAGIPKGQIRLIEAPVRKTMKWALLDKEDSGADGVDYRFYWDDWSDNVPVCHTVDDVFTLCDTFLNLTGVRIGYDPSLLVKLARIGKDSIAKDNTESNRTRWIKLCKRLLVPALSLSKSNAGVINEVFDLISLFNRETRYSMYNEWSSGRTSRNPAIKAAFDLARAETKDVLKRLSKTNAKPTARTLARIAYANPHIAINVALGQIEAYDNFAEVVTDGARYFTFLGYDILSWSLVSSLGRQGRSRVQEGGLLTSRWLSALALFAGKVYKRYSTLNPIPILQYVANELKVGNTTDLIVLEQMILFMAGIVTDTNYNESQLQAMGGGSLLQSQTILQLLDKRHDPSVKTSSRRLIRALRDSGLAGQLLLLIAQQRRMCIHSIDDADAPLKLLGNLLDEIHRILVQYLDLLKSSLSLEEFIHYVPNVTELILEFGIEPEVAFWISRSVVAHQMAEFDKANPDIFDKKKQENLLKESGDSDVQMKEDGPASEDTPAPADQPKDAATLDTTEMEGVSNDDRATKDESESPAPIGDNTRIWHPVLEGIAESLRVGLPEDISNTIGLHFYITFWQLSLYDVNIPGAAYEAELTRQNKQIVSNNGDRSDLRRRDERKKQLSDLVDNLLAENRQHLKSFAETKGRLVREKDHWFEDMFQKHEALNIALMSRCFLPRIALSPLDAVFCFKMIKFMHANATPNFRTLGFYDLIFREARLTSLIFSFSSKEADNFGRFLNEILRDLSRWHKDKAVYDREACGTKKQLPGFAKKVAPSGKPETFLDYEDFRKILYKWHTVMHKALKNCLTSTDYMHIRNAISVLKAISQYFPVVNWIGGSLQTTVSDLQKSDKEDVRVPSAALMGDLNRREKDWMIPQAFRQGDEPRIPPSKPTTPQPPSKSLNAEASEFKPTTSAQTNGDAKSDALAAATTTEDGEVDDTEMTDVKDDNPVPAETSSSEVRIEAATNGGEEESIAISKAAEAQAADASKPRVQTETPKPESRSGTPSIKEPPASVPKRPEPSRPSSSSNLDANLPRRPERPESRSLRPGEARIPSRPPEPAHDRRDQRTHPDRLDRNDDRPRDRPSHLTNGSRGSDRSGYDRPEGRDSSYRDHPADRLRDSRSRDEPQGRSPRPGAAQESHSRRSDVRASERESKMPPPQTAPSQASHSTLNPERAALIGQTPDSTRLGDEDRRAPRSRPVSPRRGDDRASRPGDRKEPPSDDRRYGRRDPDPRHGADDGRLSRHDFTADPEHGRLKDDTRPPRRRDEGSEREIPNGPRGRDAAPSRLPPSGPSSTQDRGPPSGPGRPQSRSQDHGPDSAPQTPVEASGIHPDRLKAFQSPTRGQPPSRDRQDGQPSPAQTSPPSAPAGPRSGLNNAPSNAPSGPAPVNRGPPSGPQANDNGRGRGGRNALSTVNNTLQQAGTGTSIRGRGAGRTSSISDSPTTSSVPTGPASRPDLFADSGRRGDNAPPRSEQQDERGSRPSGRRGDLIDEDQASMRRSSRHSAGSRAHSPDRQSGSGRPDRDVGHRESERDRERDHGREHRDRERDGPRDRADREKDRGHEREREPRASDSHRERERDRDRETKDTSSRRDDRSHPAAPPSSQAASGPPARRSGGRQEDPSSTAPTRSSRPPLPPQSYPGPSSDRRDSDRPPRNNDRPDSRSYNDRDTRDRHSDRRGPPPPPPGPPSGPREHGAPPSGPGSSSITPQKRGRPNDNDMPPSRGPSGGGGGNGRNPSGGGYNNRGGQQPPPPPPPPPASSSGGGGDRNGNGNGNGGPPMGMGPDNKRPRR